MTGKEKAQVAMGIGRLLGTGVLFGTGAIFGVGGLAIMANPFNADYNGEEINREMHIGMSAGITYFQDLDIDFEEIVGNIQGDLGEFLNDIEMP
jgi:hypothetical protein